MAITNPVLYTPMLDEEVDVDRPVSEELVRKLFQNINLLLNLVPIGGVEVFNVNQVGVPEPSVTLFQYCNGDEITDATSPLASSGLSHYYTPDIRSKYVRGADGSETLLTETGGNTTVNLAHDHTGFVGNVTKAPGESFGFGGIYGGDLTHKHSLASALGSVTLDLANFTVAYFLKIN